MSLTGGLDKEEAIGSNFDVQLWDLRMWLNNLPLFYQFDHIRPTAAAGVDYKEARQQHRAGKTLEFFF